MASMNVFGMVDGCSDGLFLRSYSLRFEGPRKAMKGVPDIVAAVIGMGRGLRYAIGLAVGLRSILEL